MLSTSCCYWRRAVKNMSHTVYCVIATYTDLHNCIWCKNWHLSRKDALKPYDNHCNLSDIENKCILCEHRHTCNWILYIIVKWQHLVQTSIEVCELTDNVLCRGLVKRLICYLHPYIQWPMSSFLFIVHLPEILHSQYTVLRKILTHFF